MNKLKVGCFKGCSNCALSKEKCSSFIVPVQITFKKSQKADNWGNLVTVFRKGETVEGTAVIKDNIVFCVSARSNIYDDYEDFIDLENIGIIKREDL